MNADVAVLVGALISNGLGESRYSAVAQLQLDTQRVRVSGRFDSARKIESGQGWIGSGGLAVKAGPMLLGAAYVHRDGGEWTKDTVWAEPGVKVKAVEVTGRVAVLGHTEKEVGGRVRIDLGRWVQWEGQVVKHHAGEVGFTSAVSMRFGGGR